MRRLDYLSIKINLEKGQHSLSTFLSPHVRAAVSPPRSWLSVDVCSGLWRASALETARDSWPQESWGWQEAWLTFGAQWVVLAASYSLFHSCTNGTDRFRLPKRKCCTILAELMANNGKKTTTDGLKIVLT